MAAWLMQSTMATWLMRSGSVIENDKSDSQSLSRGVHTHTTLIKPRKKLSLSRRTVCFGVICAGGGSTSCNVNKTCQQLVNYETMQALVMPLEAILQQWSHSPASAFTEILRNLQQTRVLDEGRTMFKQADACLECR